MQRRCTAGPMALLLLLPVGDWKPNMGPLTVELVPVVLRARSQAPMMFDVNLTWNRPELLEGRLEFIFYDGRRKLGWFRSQELALVRGTRGFRMTVPAMEMAQAISSYSVAVKFYTSEGQVIDLSDHDLLYPAHWRRSFVVAVSEKPQSSNPDLVALTRSMGLESHQPAAPWNIADAIDGHMTTYADRLEPAEFPTHALGYCGFDIVLITADGLPSLEAEQLQALAAWVHAGGSVCVVVNQVLEERHAAFLNRLLEPGMPPFVLSDTGTLAAGPLDEKTDLLQLRAGLGRAVLLRHAPAGNELQNRRWRDAVAFLWKVRQVERAAILRSGKWLFNAVEDIRQRSNLHYAPDLIFRTPEFGLYSPGEQDYERIVEFLIPGSVQGLPLWIVVTVLTLFLITVGPIDYFVLGYLNRRRHTWLFFFAASIGFTWFMVQTANIYLGDKDFRGRLVLLDYDDSNRAVRQSEIELLFTATQRPERTEMRNALFTPLSLDNRNDPLSKGDVNFSTRHFSEFEGTYIGEPPLVEGSMPLVFAAEYAMQQWSPRLSRYTIIVPEGDDVPAPLDFSRIDPARFGTPEGRAYVADLIHAMQPASRAFLIHAGETHRLAREDEQVAAAENSRIEDIVVPLSAAESHGLFGIVSQISPTGSHILEDLALLDRSDPKQWLLLVCSHEDHTWTVHRRLYFDGPAANRSSVKTGGGAALETGEATASMDGARP